MRLTACITLCVLVACIACSIAQTTTQLPSSNTPSFCAYGTPSNGTIAIQLLLPINSSDVTVDLLNQFKVLLDAQLQLVDSTRTVCGSFTYGFAAANATVVSRSISPSDNPVLLSFFILTNSISGPSAFEIYSRFNPQAYTSSLVANDLPAPISLAGKTICGDIQLSVGMNCNGEGAKNDSDNGLSDGAIAGIVIGVAFAFVLFIIVLIGLYRFISRKYRTSPGTAPNLVIQDYDGHVDRSQKKAEMSVATAGEYIELASD